jgi:hypothetical protein
MAIFKSPRITTQQRNSLVLQEAELVYDVDNKTFYGGDNVTPGGFLIGANSGFIVERIELTNKNIEDKSITLTNSPLVPSSVILTPEGGIPQINGVDFMIIGNILSWNGLGLDNFLDISDVLIVQY